MFIPIGVLGSAIDWPKSLGDPAAKMLPILVQNATAVRFGYLVYLGYSILFWVVAMLVIRVLERETSGSSWLRIASGFGIASAIARCLGIIRWLVAMPALATLYTDPSISAATRESIAVVYRALNDYAGSVGEVLGVSLFAALWLAIVSLNILQTGVLPRWLGFFGLVSATIFYGEGVLNSVFGDRVFIPAIQGKTAEAVGNLDMPHTYTYIGDFARAMIILGAREESTGKVWHVPNAPTISTREMLNLLFEYLELPAKMSGMGKTMMRIGGLFIPEAAESVEMMYQFEHPFIVDSSKFVKTFGDISTSHRQGISNTIAWYQEYLRSKAV